MAFSIAIVGATGVVGQTLLTLLNERQFPIKKLFLLASQQSAGKIIESHGQAYEVNELSNFDFQQTDIAFFCVGNAISAEYAPKAVAAGNIVIDKSQYFRNEKTVPLIIPEVNKHVLDALDKPCIIASPNCNTIPIAVAIKPLYDAVGIKRLNIATYQSVSGTGKEAIAELKTQSQQLLHNEAINPSVYPQQIAFNLIPHIDQFHENGYTYEEMKIVNELRKLFEDDKLAINPTAVRVPVVCGHSAAVHLETKKPIDLAEVKTLLAKAAGVKLMDGDYPYATPAKDAAGHDDVFIGRLRRDLSHEQGIDMWVVSDNLRKGAALNSLQIAEYLIKHQRAGLQARGAVDLSSESMLNVQRDNISS